MTLTRDKSPRTIAVMRPDLLEFWDWEKNAELGLDPYVDTVGMDKVAWWTCPNHDKGYDMAIDSRVKSKRGCPFCSGSRVLTGFNDIATTHPDLASEWLYAVDSDATPYTVSAGSHAMVMWRCSKHGCEWCAAVYDRANGKGCQECKSDKISASRSRVKPGNSLAEMYPDVAAQWDYELNDDTPDNVSAHARKTVHWVCNLHDEPFRWDAAIYSRTSSDQCGCPECGRAATIAARIKPCEGESLGDLYPDSLKEWAFDLNGDVTPYDVRPRSDKAFHWRCSYCGDTWLGVVGNRVHSGYFKLGCKACNIARAGRRKMMSNTNGYLKDVRPDIAVEWDHAKNKEMLDITIDVIAVSSNVDAWWICPVGHSYHATVNHRTGRGDGCNICATRTHVSYPEKAAYYYVSKEFTDAKENARPKGIGLGNLELDIWIPSIRVAIEYDGHYWHQDVTRDRRKDDICAAAGIKLIRIREPGCVDYCGTARMIHRETVYDSWSLDNAITELMRELGCDGDVDVDTARDEVDIRSLISAPGGVVPYENVPVGGQLMLNIAC